MHYRESGCWTRKLCIHLCPLVLHHQGVARRWWYLILSGGKITKLLLEILNHSFTI